MSPLVLETRDGTIIAGFRNPDARYGRIPITSGDAVVGQLAYALRDQVTEAYELNFLEQQREAFGLISLLVLRRSLANTHEVSEKLQLDNARLQLGWGNRRCEFTAVEFQLLRQLAAEPGRIFSRSQLMDGMYSDHRVVSERTIDSHIKKVRRKLEGVFGEHDAIQSVYGAGYRFELP